MKPQRSIVITTEAMKFVQFTQQLQSGDVDPDGKLELVFGEWNDCAIQLFEAYCTGYRHQSREGAMDFVGSSLYSMKANDKNLKLLLTMKPHQEDKDVQIDMHAMPPLPDSVFEGEEGINSALARTWLDSFITWSRYWSPRGHDIIHEAIGVWLLSLLAARRIVIPLGEGIFTPLYVMLAADTSTYAKSFTLSKAKSLLRYMSLNHLLIPGEMTPEVFIKLSTGKAPDNWEQMSDDEQARLCKELAFAGQRGICFDEFGAQLGQLSQAQSPMKGFYRIFLTWDGCPSGEDVSKHTISRGSDVPRNPYLALMTCLTVDNIQQLAKGTFWNDGFFARQAIISPPENEWNNLQAPEEQISFPSDVTDPLMSFYERLGVPRVTDVTPEMNGKGQPTGKFRAHIEDAPVNECSLGDGVRAARIRYDDALADMRRQKLVPQEMAGNYGRFSEKALRVAALLSWMNNGGRIEMEHWIAARDITEHWRQGLHEFYRQLNASKNSFKREVEDAALALIEAWSEKGGLTAAQVAARNRQLDSKTAHEMLTAMTAIGRVARYKIPGGKAGTREIIIYKSVEAEPPENAIYDEEAEQGRG